MDKVKLSDVIFHFMELFFLEEASGRVWGASSNCIKERWKLCEACEHYDEPEEGCKYCMCYLPNKIKDPFGECPLDKWTANSEQWNETDYEIVKQRVIELNPEMEDYINGKD